MANSSESNDKDENPPKPSRSTANSLKAVAETKEIDLEKTISELNVVITELNSQIKHKSETLTILSTDHESCKFRLKHLQKQYEDMEKKNIKLNLINSKNSTSLLQKKIKTLENRLKVTQKELNGSPKPGKTSDLAETRSNLKCDNVKCKQNTKHVTLVCPFRA